MTAPDRPRISEDPEVSANIARLAEETGIPVARYERLLASDPPPGIRRADWVDALLNRGRGHRPWSEQMLQQLSRMAAAPPSASAEDAA